MGCDTDADRCGAAADDAGGSEGGDDAGASFQLFKYKVLLTQLDAARARRADAMDRLEKTRVESEGLFRSIYGRGCDAELGRLIPGSLNGDALGKLDLNVALEVRHFPAQFPPF